MVGKEIISKKIIDNLDMCNIEKCDEYLEVVLPVVLSFNQQLITLRVYPFEDGYYIATLDTMFDEYIEYAPGECEKYYDSFIKNDSHYHYDIKREGACLYKKYDSDRSARTAVDEFVKFLVYLDEYIIKTM